MTGYELINGWAANISVRFERFCLFRNEPGPPAKKTGMPYRFRALAPAPGPGLEAARPLPFLDFMPDTTGFFACVLF